MTHEEIINAIREVVKGRYFNITKRKDVGNGIVKETDMRVRLGVRTSHMSIYENKEVGQRAWGHYVKEFGNLVVEDTLKDKKTKEPVKDENGNVIKKYYLHVVSCTPEHPESGADVVATRYYKDDKEISFEEAVEAVGAKKLEDSKAVMYDIKFENLVKIGK